MKIYLAGGVSGNLNGYFKLLMKYYFAGTESRKYLLEEECMNLFLAGEHGVKNGAECLSWKDLNILESFYYASKNPHIPRLIQEFGNFLLDSGAFTFMQGSHKGMIDWGEYTRNYAEFINRYNVELFFELDIDSIVGIEKVEFYRNMLESMTGKKPIPVWHKKRGKQYFIDMCKEYPYVALGGIVSKEIPRDVYEKAFPWFIRTAHEYGAKIHGLGYTSIEGVHKYHFDSVDSTAWLYGNRGGYLYKFNPSTGNLDKYKKSGRLKSREGAMFNFREWVKFLKYADKNL